jgi:hypothetical protein
VQYLRASFPGICFVDQRGLSQRASRRRPRTSGMGVTVQWPLPRKRRERTQGGSFGVESTNERDRIESETSQSSRMNPCISSKYVRVRKQELRRRKQSCGAEGRRRKCRVGSCEGPIE